MTWSSATQSREGTDWPVAPVLLRRLKEELNKAGCRITLGSFGSTDDSVGPDSEIPTADPRALGTFRLIVKEMPAFNIQDIWNPSLTGPVTLHIENEDSNTAKHEFLSRDQARRALADQISTNQLNLVDFWTDPDPVGRRGIATLLHRAAQGLSTGRQNPAQRPT